MYKTVNLDRPAITPKFVTYAIEYALQSSEREWTDEIKNLDPNPIKIPSYQRRIVWDEETIGDFLDSKAVVFGTVILAKSPVEEPLILLDGLQRFATSTAILNYLHTDILPRMSNKTDIKYFERLTADTESKKNIFKHNDKELRNNRRRGIRESYEQLYENVISIIDKLNQNSEELAEKLIQTFIKKQIAIDTYHGFKNAREYTQTFININSTGIELTPVDLLRSEIIQRAETNDWPPSDVDDIENRFTEVFQSSKIKATRVLGKHMYDALMQDPNTIFKNWDHLNKDDVDNLLDFIDRTYDASVENDKDGNKKWPYLYENFQCGDIPFSIIVWFYYQKFQNGENPDFLGGPLDTTDDLRALLRAFYRRVISSSMNRADGSASKLIHGKEKLFNNMKNVANDVNPTDESLDEFVDAYWIKKNIKKSSTNKLRRIFNACLLPHENSDEDFYPLQYGTGTLWTIEYLIQKRKNMDNENREYVETLMNKIPIPSDIRKNLKNKTCMEKLQSSDMHNIKNLHPYIEWLVSTHYSKYKNTVLNNTNEYILNLPKLSDANNLSVTNDRLEQIAELLRTRI